MEEKKTLQVLLVTGNLTSEHDARISSWIRYMLEATGRFRVKITEEFRGATAETLAPYDLVFVNYDGKETVHDVAVRWGETAEAAVLAFVRSGKGIVFLHSAVWIECWPEAFLPMMGGCCDFRTGSRKTPASDFTVRHPTPDHPITRGLVSSWHTVGDDLFTPTRWASDAPVEVVATIYDDPDEYDRIPPHMAQDYTPEKRARMTDIGTDIPVAWTNRYGEGRAFVVTIGHGPDTVRRMPFVAMLCRGCEWAATGGVTLPVPDITRERRLVGWPYYGNDTVVEIARRVTF
jgi:uncharacterized protein